MNSSETILLTVPEACQHLQVCRATLYKLARRGELPLVRIGAATRIRRADLEALIERLREPEPAS